MANKRWTGGAQARRYQGTLTPTNFEEGDLLRLKINRKTLEVPGGAAEDMVATCVELLQQTNEPEWRELEVLSPLDEDDDPTVLVIAGPEDGRQVTLLTETVNAGGFGFSLEPSFRVTVTTVQHGFNGQNERVHVAISEEANGGTFTLTFGGHTTAAIDYDATAAEFELAFEALASVGAGNCTVTGTARDWTIEFTGSLAYTNVGAVTGDGTNLVGGVSAEVTTTTEGSSGASPRFRLHPGIGGYFSLAGYLPPPKRGTITQEFDATNPSNGAYDFWSLNNAIGSKPTGVPYLLPYNCTAEDIVTHLLWCEGSLPKTEDHAWIYSQGYCSVSSDPDYPGQFLLEWHGPLFDGVVMGGEDIGGTVKGMYAVNDYNHTLTEGQTRVTTEIAGSATQNEIQQIAMGVTTLNGSPITASLDRWRIGYAGELTSELIWGATATQVQAALESLTNLSPGDISVTRTGSVEIGQLNYQITFQGSLAHTNVEQVTVDRPGQAKITPLTYGGENGENEIQSIALEIAQAGTWTITFDGQTTSGLGPAATATEVQAALVALTTIGTGNVAVEKSVSGQVATYTLSFQGDLEKQDVSQVTVDTSGLSGGPVSITVAQQSAVQKNEIQRITASPNSGESTIAPGMTFVLAISTDATSPVAYNASAASLQAALEALPSIGSGNVSVSGGGDTLVWTVTFQGGKAATNLDTLRAYTPGVLTFEGGATGGTFTLTYLSQTTNGIAIDAAAATIQSELAALSTIGSGNVEVTGNAGGPWYIFFAGDLAAANVLDITGSTVNLIGPGTQYIALVESHPTGPNWFTDRHNWADDALPQNGDTLVYEAGDTSCLYGIDAYLLVTITGNPNGGGWSMAYKGYGPAAGDGLEDAVLNEHAPVPAELQLAYNATAAQVQAYLEGISCIGAGGVTVTGNAGGPYTILFHGPATTDNGVILLVADGTELLVDGDTGIAGVNVTQTCLRPAGLRKKQNYSGDIGLPPHSGDYVEYRPQRLRIGGTGDSVTIDLGEGDGTGSGLVRINTAGANVTLTTYNTGSQSDDTVPAVEWVGTGTNSVTVYRGSFGAAIFEDDVASIATLTIGYQETRDTDAVVTIGRCVTLGNVVKTGGEAYFAGRSGSSINSIVHSGGTLTIDGADAVSQLTISGGTVYYNTSGTLGGSTIVSGASTLDFSRDLRPKTVTNPIEVFGTQHLVRDPENVVTSLIVDGNHCRPNVEMGGNVRITRGATA